MQKSFQTKSTRLKLIEHAVLSWPLTKVPLGISCPAVAPISIEKDKLLKRFYWRKFSLGLDLLAVLLGLLHGTSHRHVLPSAPTLRCVLWKCIIPVLAVKDANAILGGSKFPRPSPQWWSPSGTGPGSTATAGSTFAHADANAVEATGPAAGSDVRSQVPSFTKACV